MELHYKEPGETMNQFIIKIINKIDNKRIAYTARLDPMARGIVPILVGDECKKINNYLKTNKTYRVKIIKGIQTDSDDPLGLIEKIDNLNNNIDLDILKINYPITFNQKYHYFSTKALNHRKQNILKDNYHEVTILKSKILSEGRLNFTEWKENIINQINNIDNKKNFRQDLIINQWNKLSFDSIDYLEIELHVTSGFFVRQFIRDLSDKINYPLMCFDIHRIEIGKSHEL